MLEAMGMKRLINHSAMPTTTNAITILIKGILVAPRQDEQAIHDPMSCAGRVLHPNQGHSHRPLPFQDLLQIG